jgi:2-methylcitrate dehydratase PrpD
MTGYGGPPGLVGRLGEFAADVRQAGLDTGLRHQAVRRMRDRSGNCLLARTEDTASAMMELARSWGGPATAGVFGTADRLPAPSAALVNGTLAHALDFDDSHVRSVLHPSAPVLPAALAAAQAVGAAGGVLLDAATVGTEICIRLGMAGYDPELGNSVFFDRGQHATSICGTLGAAAAAAMIFGADATGIADAVAVAASMGSGLLEANRTGGTVKRIHCGWAAHAGVMAASMAMAGITGPPTALEGRFGFFQAWCGDHANPAAVTDGLGTVWQSSRIIFKPYPCNHFTHPGIDAALLLRDKGLRPEEVAEARLGVPSIVLRTIAEPRDIKLAPPSGYAAAFSGPYTVACALLGGSGLGVWLDEFTDEAINDPARTTLAAKVHCVPDPWCESFLPEQLAAVLTVRTVDGRELEARVEHSRGMITPLLDAEVDQKFRLAAATAMSAEQADLLHKAVLRLADGGPVDDVFQYAAPD